MPTSGKNTQELNLNSYRSGIYFVSLEVRWKYIHKTNNKEMKKVLILILLSSFFLVSCSTSKKCDGGKKIKTNMW